MNDNRVRLPIALVVGAILSLIFVAGFATGLIVRDIQGASGDSTSDANLKDFMAAYHLVTQQSYYRPFDRQHLIYAAIDGMLSATGDPHTLFLSPDENRLADNQLNGSQFSGIGAIVVPCHSDLQVVVPLPKAPAAEAGVQAGDIVTEINGQRVSTMSGTSAVARIHGPSGTFVHLTVRRGRRGTFTFRVRRAQIPPVTAYTRFLGHHLADIQVTSFGENTSQEVADGIAFAAAHHARGIVLDLRGNPGGYVDAAQHIVSQFLSRGVVAYERGVDKHLQPLPVIAGASVTRLPVAVLVDAGTASAAEITAAALRDNGRATVIGTRTYGKGSMQSVYGLADGSSVRITDRLWLTPKKQSIQKVGILPDIVVNGEPQPCDSADTQLVTAERYLADHART